jgi:2-polyprenyl-6-methoxyphenol hydroxylase-like FAD-dependent oxidoreductase
MNDTWIDEVAVPGVVFIGDAAGYSDPVIGQGLSIALRDARVVADVVTSGVDWTPSAFLGYRHERQERMHRFRVCAFLYTELHCTFTPAGRDRRAAFFAAVAQDPTLSAPTLLTALAGPEAAPAEAFDPWLVERILALTCVHLSRVPTKEF